MFLSSTDHIMHSPPPCLDGLMLNKKKLTSRKLQGKFQQTHHLSSFLSTKNLKVAQSLQTMVTRELLSVVIH